MNLYDGTERLLEEVRYIPRLKQNLISLGESEKKGYVFKRERRVLKVLRGSLVVIKAVRRNNLYALEAILISRLASTVEKIILSKIIYDIKS